MANQYQRARQAAWEYHRRIATKEAWFCMCGEPGTDWPITEPQFWVHWGNHFSEKVAEIQKKLNGA